LILGLGIEFFLSKIMMKKTEFEEIL